MANLPRLIEFEMAGRRLTVVHGASSAINRYIFESTENTTVVGEIERSGSDGVLCGHSGLPFTRLVDGRLWHNAGVIGLPANDGTPRVWFSTFIPTGDKIVIEHRALGYDHVRAAQKCVSEAFPRFMPKRSSRVIGIIVRFCLQQRRISRGGQGPNAAKSGLLQKNATYLRQNRVAAFTSGAVSMAAWVPSKLLESCRLWKLGCSSQCRTPNAPSRQCVARPMRLQANAPSGMYARDSGQC